MFFSGRVGASSVEQACAQGSISRLQPSSSARSTCGSSRSGSSGFPSRLACSAGPVTTSATSCSSGATGHVAGRRVTGLAASTGTSRGEMLATASLCFGGSGIRGQTRTRGALQKVAGLPFSVPEFRQEKLSFEFRDGCSSEASGQPSQRCYTLTHNDLTGELYLTVGRQPNVQQISGWYNRLVRDEVLAEWRVDDTGCHALHVHCHVSGEERWMAPPQLRSYIFRREMQLVLDCFIYADAAILSSRRAMAEAPVYVHLNSHIPALDCCEFWGILGDRATWRAVPISMFESLWGEVLHEGPSCDVANHPPEVLPSATKDAIASDVIPAPLKQTGSLGGEVGGGGGRRGVMLNNAVPGNSKLLAAQIPAARKALQSGSSSNALGRPYQSDAAAVPGQVLPVPVTAASAVRRARR